MKQRRLQQFPFGLVLVLLSLSSTAGELADPHYWLEKMAAATHTLDYDGTFIYEHQGRLQTMRIVHSAGQSGERERLVTLSGPPREVIRDGGQVTCILPDSKAVMVEGSAPAPFRLPILGELRRLEENYRFAVAGDDRIAGLPVRKVTIEPRDSYRYGQNIWLHTETGLLLKSELVNEKGQVVERLLFTSIKLYERVPEELLKPETKGQDLTWYRPNTEESSRSAGDSGWEVQTLPPGFRKDVHRRHFMPKLESAVEHMVFTDGLASVSVFIERDGEEAFTGQSRMGAVNAYGRMVGDHRVTVVGEVPPQTVRLIADSVGPRPREAPR